jgi:hypothetical protein
MDMISAKLGERAYNCKAAFVADMKQCFDNYRCFFKEGMFYRSAEKTELALLKNLKSANMDELAAGDPSVPMRSLDLPLSMRTLHFHSTQLVRPCYVVHDLGNLHKRPQGGGNPQLELHRHTTSKHGRECI